MLSWVDVVDADDVASVSEIHDAAQRLHREFPLLCKDAIDYMPAFQMATFWSLLLAMPSGGTAALSGVEALEVAQAGERGERVDCSAGERERGDRSDVMAAKFGPVAGIAKSFLGQRQLPAAASSSSRRQQQAAAGSTLKHCVRQQ